MLLAVRGSSQNLTTSMAEEFWNKVNIPFPNAISVYRIPFSKQIDTALECIAAGSEKFLDLFCSEVLQTEVRLLYECLYLLRNSFRQHKTLSALKQLEQCINRVKEMRLQEALQDYWEACPKKPQRSAGLELGMCDVPSQACVEWMCVKILGGATLISRLLDRCSRAFIWCKQHMQTGEFTVLNLMLVSMLSRLWVLFRGLLRALCPLYQHSLDLLQQVSVARPLPYLSPSTPLPPHLPDHLASLLGPQQASLLLEVEERRPRRGGRASLLNRLFGEQGAGEEDANGDGGVRKRMLKRSVGVRKAREVWKVAEDLGSVVLQRRADVMGVGAELDIKALLMGSKAGNTQIAALTNQKPSSCEDPAVIGQKREFVKQLNSASSFAELAATLQEVMRWCQDRNRKGERQSLVLMSVKCRRMVSLEAEGHSVKRKLQRFQSTVGRALMQGISHHHHPHHHHQRCHSLRTLWRRNLGCRDPVRIATVLQNQHRTAKQRRRTPGAGSKTLTHKDTRTRTSGPESRTVSKDLVLPQQPVTAGDVAEEELTGSDVNMSAGNRKCTSVSKQAAVDAEEDDIDDIFASIGF